MVTLDSALNFIIPALLVIIAVGFVYVKMINPWIVPHLIKLYGWIQNDNPDVLNQPIRREITYD